MLGHIVKRNPQIQGDGCSICRQYQPTWVASHTFTWTKGLRWSIYMYMFFSRFFAAFCTKINQTAKFSLNLKQWSFDHYNYPLEWPMTRSIIKIIQLATLSQIFICTCIKRISSSNFKLNKFSNLSYTLCCISLSSSMDLC